MSKVFYRKKFSDYLGEQRAIDDIVQFYQPDGGITPTPTPVPVTPTPTPTPSITPSITPTSTLTPTPTKTSTPTPTRTPAPACDITYTELPSPTPSPTPTITPTITPTASPVVVWSPSQLSNLNDWWSTSFGVVLSGFNVDAWTGYNGKNFTPYNASNKAVYSASDSNWNNQPSITINPSNAGGEWGYKAPTNITAATQPISAFVVARNNTLIDERPLLMIWSNSGGNQRMASLWRTSGGNTLWGYTDVLPNVSYSSLGVNDAAPSYIFNELLYNPPAGTMDWFASNTSVLGPSQKSLGGRIAFALNEIQLGTYFGLLGSLNFSVVEVIMVNGIVPPGELSQLENYINTTYGI